MSDVTCPYCETEQEINHDGGYGCDENTDHQQYCTNCDKAFKFTTSISFNYEVSCQSEDHNMEPFGDKCPGMFQCSKCDFYQKET